MAPLNQTSDSDNQAGTRDLAPEDVGYQKDSTTQCPPGVPTLAELRSLPQAVLRERLEAIPPETRSPLLEILLQEIQKDQDAACKTFFQEQLRPTIDETVHKAVGAAVGDAISGAIKEAVATAVKEAGGSVIANETRAIGDLVERLAPTVEKTLEKISEQGTRAVGDLVDRVTPTLLKINDKNNTVDRPSLEYLSGVLALARQYNADLTVGDIEVCLQEEPPPKAPARSRSSKKAE